MPDLDEAQRAKLAQLLELPTDKLAALAQLDAADLAKLTAGIQPADDGGDDLLSEAELDQLVNAALAMDAAGLLDDDATAPDAQPALAGAALSNEDRLALELAQATGDEAHRQLGIISDQLDRERWLNERRKLVGEGTPPFIADLAQPLLEGAAHTVELSNGSSVDSGQIVRRILGEYNKIMSQLGVDVELGSPMDEPDDGSAATARDDLVSRAKAQMFGIQA